MFNAFKHTKQLEDAGFSRLQAEVQLQIINEIIEGDLATKQDLNISVERLEHKMLELEHKMLEMEYRLIIKIGTIITIAIGASAALIKFF